MTNTKFEPDYGLQRIRILLARILNCSEITLFRIYAFHLTTYYLSFDFIIHRNSA